MIESLHWHLQFTYLRNCRKQQESNEKNQKKLAMAITMAHIINPMIAVGFIAIYWIVGTYKNTNPEIIK